MFEDTEILKEIEKKYVGSSGDNTSHSSHDEMMSEVSNMQENIEKGIMNDDITIDEVRTTFGTSRGAPGPDRIQADLVDNADRESMEQCLLLLWQKGWAQGQFPSAWKLEHRSVLPKPDKEDYHETSAYRTVALTSILGKRFESITARRLSCHLASNGFDENQFAYLKGKSTTQALLLLTERLKKAIFEKKVAGAVFFDFTDAFGSVNRMKLLQKIASQLGVNGRLLSHLKSFLEGRKARVCVNELVGDWIESNQGTSAGTILGPILFIMFVHDVPVDIKPRYADDLAGVKVTNSVRETREQLQEAVNRLWEWSVKWDMSLNVGKTKVMLFGDTTSEISLMMGGKEIGQVRSFKYLGVVLDPYLKFDLHAEYTASKATKSFYNVNKLLRGRSGINVKLGTELFVTLVRPHLEYGAAIWGGMGDNGMKMLERVQYQCLRKIVGAMKNVSADAVQVITNIPPLRNRVKELCAREFFKMESMKPGSSLRNAVADGGEIKNRQFTPVAFLKQSAKKISDELATRGIKIEQQGSIEEEALLDTYVIQWVNVVVSVDMLLSGFKGTADSKVSHRVWRALWEFIQETEKIL